MLPRKIPKSRNRTDRWKSSAHRDFVRGHECIVDGCHRRPIEVAHIRFKSDASTGRKPSDWYTVSMCGGPDGHHAESHRIGERSFELKYRVDLHELAEEFCKASPKAPEIRRERESRDG